MISSLLLTGKKMDEDWNDKFFNELSVNAIGILSWDDKSHHWIVSTFDKSLVPPPVQGGNGVAGMVWDSTTLTWKGNDGALETFNFE